MTETNGYNVTQSTATIDDASNSTVPVFELHPGITAIISFGAAIFMIIVYLYYDNALFCVKTLCFRRRPPDTTSETTTEGASPKLKTPINGDFNKEAAAVPESVRKTINREPAIMCECGQIHLLKDCVNNEEMKPYEQLFSKTDTKISPETISCDVIDELPRNGVAKRNGRVMLFKGQETRVEEEQLNPSSESVSDTKSEATEPPKSDSEESSPQCVTPLIQVKPAKPATDSPTKYAYSGARPKQRMQKEAVS